MEITPKMLYAQQKITEKKEKEDEKNLKETFGEETAKFMQTHGMFLGNLEKEDEIKLEKINAKIHAAEKEYKSKFPEYDMNNEKDRQAFREVYIAFHTEELLKEGIMDKPLSGFFQMDKIEIEDYMKRNQTV